MALTYFFRQAQSVTRESGSNPVVQKWGPTYRRLGPVSEMYDASHVWLMPPKDACCEGAVSIFSVAIAD